MSRRSIRSNDLSAAGVALVGLLASSAALARPPGKDEVQAKARYAEAQGLYDTGQFEEALQGYSDAYELKPLPGFLFNIGQCHRQLGNWERARFFYKRYLDLSPKRPKNAAQVQSLLKQAEARLVEQDEKRRREERAARLENERKQADLDRQKKDAELSAAKRQAELDQQKLDQARKQAALDKEKKAAELEQAKKLAAIESEKDARRAALERSLKAGPEGPAQPTPLHKQWWLWAGVGAVVAGGAVAWVATAPKPPETTLGEVSYR